MRRSSWYSPIFTGRCLPAVSFIGSGGHVLVPRKKKGEEEEREQWGWCGGGVSLLSVEGSF